MFTKEWYKTHPHPRGMLGKKQSDKNKRITRENAKKLVLSKEARKKISDSKMLNKNPQWKGDSVGIKALHSWVKRHLKKSKVCEDCKKEKPLDLANKSNKYLRDLTDWEWLCRRCHMIKDGRINNLLKGGKY